MSDIVTYRGQRHTGPNGELLGVTVGRDDRGLDPRPSWKLRNHSPTGFEWGYNGSGPSQLALALLFDATRDAELALLYYQDFKRAYVAGWGATWSITDREIRKFIVDTCKASISRGDAAVEELPAPHFEVGGES